MEEIRQFFREDVKIKKWVYYLFLASIMADMIHDIAIKF